MSDDNTSADTSSSTELKAGHAPATKVGGMRVGAPRPRHTSQGEDKNNQGTEGNNAGDDAAATNQGENKTAENDNQQASGDVANRVAGELVGGTFVPIQKAFPTEAVKHIHDKPGTQPKHDAHSYTKHDDQRFINQPRKQ